VINKKQDRREGGLKTGQGRGGLKNRTTP